MTDRLGAESDAIKPSATEPFVTAPGVTAPGGFGGAKGPDALRTIGEVATALGLKQHVLRYWEEQFPMLRPIKRSGGRRYYRAEDIALLRTIHRLVDEQGYTLRGARLAIEASGGAMAATSTGPPGLASVPPVASDALPMTAIHPDMLPGEALVRLRHVRRVLSEALAAS